MLNPEKLLILAATPALGLDGRYPTARPPGAEGIGEPSGHSPLGGEQPWSRQHYLAGRARDWTPEAIPLDEDARQWGGDALQPEERALLHHLLGLVLNLSAASATVAPVRTILPWLDDGDARRCLDRQLREEALRPRACRHLMAGLGIDPASLPLAGRAPAAMRGLLDYLQPDEAWSPSPEVRLATEVARLLVIKYLVSIPAMLPPLALARRGLLPGTGRLFQLTWRDELAHRAFAGDLFAAAAAAGPEHWRDLLQERLAETSEALLEHLCRCVYEALPRGILGLNAPMLEQQLLHAAEGCRRRADLPAGAEHPSPFPWLETHDPLSIRTPG